MNKRIIGLLCLPLLAVSVLVLVPAASAAAVEIKVASTNLGKIVVNGKGMTAYFYDRDKANSGKSACIGVCLAYWPPILSAQARPIVSGVSGRISSIPTAKGKRQITINGRPIYSYSLDKVPGDVLGQGVQGIWHVLSGSGHEIKGVKVLSPEATPAASTTQSYRYERSY